MAVIKTLLQTLLGAFLLSAGTSHLGSNRIEFLAQVPTWLPVDPDFVVVASGLVEITLGALLITTALIFKKYRAIVGVFVDVNRSKDVIAYGVGAGALVTGLAIFDFATKKDPATKVSRKDLRN